MRKQRTDPDQPHQQQQLHHQPQYRHQKASLNPNRASYPPGNAAGSESGKKKRIYLFELFVFSFNKEFLSQVYKLFYVVIISQLVVNNYWFYSYYKLKGKQPNLIRTAVNSLQSTHTMY